MTEVHLQLVAVRMLDVHTLARVGVGDDGSRLRSNSWMKFQHKMRDVRQFEETLCASS